MFKRVFQSLSHSFRSKKTEPLVTQTIRSAPPSFTGARPSKKKGLTEIADTRAESQVKPPGPEELCGINAKMPRDEMKKHLAALYRRFNRAASSLDASLRAEAEMMLDAIVMVREKYFDSI